MANKKTNVNQKNGGNFMYTSKKITNTDAKNIISGQDVIFVDDFEKVIIKKFDLALRKWVTQAIVIENGKQTQVIYQPMGTGGSSAGENDREGSSRIE